MAPRVRFIHASSGAEINIDDWSWTTKIRYESTVEEYFDAMHKTLRWPRGFFHFLVKTRAGEDVIVKDIHRIRDRTRTMMRDLQQELDENVTVRVVLLQPPDVYDAGLCACCFGSCCLLCNTPKDRPCDGCGNTGCCRTGDCGHECCEDCHEGRMETVSQFSQLCPYSGCRQSWAAEFPWQQESNAQAACGESEPTQMPTPTHADAYT